MATASQEKVYDLLIIGGGPAGGAAAETALNPGKTVALVERDKLGGGVVVRAHKDLQFGRTVGKLVLVA